MTVLECDMPWRDVAAGKAGAARCNPGSRPGAKQKEAKQPVDSPADPRELLPKPFWSVTNPLLWKPEATVREAARAALVALFRLLPTNYREWAISTVKADARKALRATSLQDAQLVEEAAALVFCSPPARRHRVTRELREGCLVLRNKPSKHIKFIQGYPYLVLQEGNRLLGTRRVMIKAADLTAHITHSLRRSGQRPVLCHYDEAVPLQQRAGLEWKEEEECCCSSSKSEQPQPMQSRCVSKCCVSPLCLAYDTQSSNARTGKHHTQLPGRKARQLRPKGCRCSQCVASTQAAAAAVTPIRGRRAAQPSSSSESGSCISEGTPLLLR